MMAVILMQPVETSAGQLFLLLNQKLVLSALTADTIAARVNSNGIPSKSLILKQ